MLVPPRAVDCGPWFADSYVWLTFLLYVCRQNGSDFVPHVSLEDGLAAVEMGITAQKNVSNKAEEEDGQCMKPLVAFSTKSSDQLINLAIGLTQMPIPTTPSKLHEEDFNYFYEEEKET